MREALIALRAFYGPLAAPPSDLFAFVVWETISARTLPARRDMAWQALRRLPALTPDAMSRASKESLEHALEALTGREQRIEMLRAGSGHFRRHRDLPDVVGGRLSRAWRALADVPHLSAASRARALLFAGGHPLAPVDDALARTLARLRGWEKAPTRALQRRARRHLAAECEGDLAQLRDVAVVLGHHADHACADQPHCTVCPLAKTCAYARLAAAPAS